MTQSQSLNNQEVNPFSDQNSDICRETLKRYFQNNPGIVVDSVGIINYFHLPAYIGTLKVLADEGWLEKVVIGLVTYYKQPIKNNKEN